MTSKIPAVSVLMTVRNCERYVREAVESILLQTFKDFELVIVDNASTDRTCEIISSFDDPRILLIKNQRNLGQTKALNIGLRQSRAELIARMDGDDISLSHRLERQFEYLSGHRDIAVLGAQYREIDETGAEIRRFHLPTEPIEIKGYLLASPELTRHSVPHPLVMMRRKAIFEVGLYDESYVAQDYDLWLRLSRRYFFANLDEVLFRYRLTSGAQSRVDQEMLRQNCAQAIRRNIEFYCPDWDRESVECLAQMLTFSVQNSRESGSKVLDLFGDYFNRAMGCFNGDARVKKLRDRIQLYYLPKLWRTNPHLAFETGFRLMSEKPGCLFDKRLYARVLKSLMSLDDTRGKKVSLCVSSETGESPMREGNLRPTMKDRVRLSRFGEILCRASLRMVRDKRFEEWPGWVGKACGIHLPKKVLPKRVRDASGGVNIKILLDLLKRASVVPGDIAECGVFQGASLIPMGLYVKEARLEKTIFGLDSFTGFQRGLLKGTDLGGATNLAKRTGGFSNTCVAYVERQIRIFGLTSEVKLIPGFFEETLNELGARQFCFVHLDCDLYESYKVCLEFFYPKMSRGGVILLDEYNDAPWPGCNKAVDEFLLDKKEGCVPVESDRYIKYFIQKD